MKQKHTLTARSQEEAFASIVEEFPNAGGYRLLSRRTKSGKFSKRGSRFQFEIVTTIDLGPEEY